MNPWVILIPERGNIAPWLVHSLLPHRTFIEVIPVFIQVSAMDESIGVILKGLKDLDLEEDTLVLFTSDNGPEVHKPSDWYNTNFVFIVIAVLHLRTPRERLRVTKTTKDFCTREE
jgi:hypothetical protein